MEPVYVYEKGKGWIPSLVERYVGYKYHDGQKYRVTISKENCAGKRGIYCASGMEYAFKSVTWFCKWNNIPAGFGGGQGEDPHEKSFLVTTELVEE